MSRTRHTDEETRLLRRVCTQCGADAQDWCRTRTSRYSRYLHPSRGQAASSKFTQQRQRMNDPEGMAL